MKRIMMMALLAMMLTTTAAFAAHGEWSGGGQGGMHIPSGDYADFAKSGYVLGVFLNYGVTPMFTLGVNLDLNSTKAKDEFINANAGVDEVKATLFNYGVNGALSFMPEATVHPYVKVGGGMYNQKLETSAFGFTSDESTNDFGFCGGAGLMFQPAGNPVGFGVEALYHNVLTQDSSSQFITVAGRISFSFSDASQK